MKKRNLIPILISILIISCTKDNDYQLPKPSLRYFKFSSCDHTSYWQNTSFIAATSDPKVIKQCLDELKLPTNSRTLFPFGTIKEGNGGYNKNGAHNFNWHYEDGSWELVEVGIEIYDGCAYTEAELGNYAKTLGIYGGWNNRIIK